MQQRLVGGFKFNPPEKSHSTSMYFTHLFKKKKLKKNTYDLLALNQLKAPAVGRPVNRYYTDHSHKA